MRLPLGLARLHPEGVVPLQTCVGFGEQELFGDVVLLLQSPAMKIQERPSIPDTKLQRTQDAEDQQESFVSEVPELDLTALCDEKSWEGRIGCYLDDLLLEKHI